MSERPHLLVAGGLLLLALIAALPRLLGGVPGYPTPTEDLTLPLDPATDPVESAAVLDPLVPAHGGGRTRNPFSLRAELSRVQVSLPLPPPPPLDSPLPPAVFDLGGDP